MNTERTVCIQPLSPPAERLCLFLGTALHQLPTKCSRPAATKDDALGSFCANPCSSVFKKGVPCSLTLPGAKCPAPERCLARIT